MKYKIYLWIYINKFYLYYKVYIKCWDGALKKVWYDITNGDLLFNNILISFLFILISCVILYEHFDLYLLHFIYWNWDSKSKIWCNKIKLYHLLVILLVYWYWFEYLVYVSYIVHDLGALKVAQKIQVMGSL